MFHPSTAMVVHGDGGDEELIEDPVVLGTSRIQRRQQGFVQEEVIVNNLGVVDKLDRVLQDSQARNDEKLLELAQYAHDHVINTVAETEERLGYHIRDYLDGIHAHYDASMKQQGELQAVEPDRRLSSLEHNIQERAQTSAVAAVGSLANKLEFHFNSALAAMETTLNGHGTTHESVCEMRLQSASKQAQDDFEASTDLQSDWIEK
ncbi:hypothetical protein F442_22362 [Phytophthora nicotianae P10297]|uniref:Uncharacterized protein n=2 Tax=Phytophthora nicotianae TaxID=4792 RepID=W2Y144_PHYNI|nr:hypothetical protein L914_03005 [Phytophthora nicotianae]ETP28348.1 hypothetical protein F442_22362 [Phytophthora nicotianae P10297]